MTSTAHHGELAQDDALALDAWLQRPDVRLVRALRHLEWMTADQIFESIKIAPREIPLFARALARLVESGHVRRTGEPGYYHLERDLEPPAPPRARNTAPIVPGNDGEERNGWFFWRGSWRRQ